LPPSINALYQRRGGGGIALKPAAKTYDEGLRRKVADHLYLLQEFPLTLETVYQLDIKLYFEKLENPGWFELFEKGPNKGKRKAKSRYKKIDYDNRIKFLQDRIVKAIGIPDDAQIFRGIQEKLEDKESPRAEVIITAINGDQFFPRRRDGH
jgi:Holliday junction resolvase RusA-like endonuclease